MLHFPGAKTPVLEIPKTLRRQRRPHSRRSARIARRIGRTDASSNEQHFCFLDGAVSLLEPSIKPRGEHARNEEEADEYNRKNAQRLERCRIPAVVAELCLSRVRPGRAPHREQNEKNRRNEELDQDRPDQRNAGPAVDVPAICSLK